MFNDLAKTHPKGSQYIEWIAYISILAGSLFYCYETILRVAPSAINVELMSYFNLGNDKAAYDVLNSYYYYIYAPMQLLVGLLVDRYGPKRWLMIASITCSLGVFLYVVNPDYWWVSCLGRFLVGFGSSFAFIGVLKLASIWLPVNRFALVAGFCVTLGQLGAFGVDYILPQMVQAFDVYHSFLILSLAGIAVFAIVTLFVRDETSSDTECSKNLSKSVGQLARGLDRLVHKKDLWLICGIGLLMWMPLVLFAENLGIDFLKKMYGFTDNASKIVGIFFLGWAVGAPIVNYYSNIIGSRKKPMLWGAIAALLIFCMIWSGAPLTLFSNPFALETALYVLIFLFGFVSSVQVIVFAAAKELSCPNTSGTATSITNMVTMFSGFIPPLCGWLAAKSPLFVKGIDFDAQHVEVFQYYLSPVILAIAASIVFILFMNETFVESGFANDEDEDS